MIRVVILGNGNVGSFFAQQCDLSSKVELVQWYGRNNSFSKHINAPRTTQLKELLPAELYLLCVSDSAIVKLAEQLKLEGLIAHTAGAVSMDALALHPNHGVCYPLQSISKQHFPKPEDVPLCIEGADDAAVHLLENFATALEMPNQRVSSSQRKELHLAAVFSNNFSNHLYTRAAALCEAKQLDFKLLFPLISHTVAQLQQHPPRSLQTGPAIRKEEATIAEHLNQLNDPNAKEIYILMTKAIQDYYE